MEKLKILIVNKFLYPRGGDCICTLNLRNLLEKNGHKVVFFSMNHPQNIDYPESQYFADEISFEGGIGEKLKAAGRIIWGIGIKTKFEKLLDTFQPNVVHLNNIHSYISPIVAHLAYQRKIKVVWTMHDYKLICPSYSCLCHGKICESCFKNKFYVIARKCMKNSIAASLLSYLEALQWNKKCLSKWTDTFICPSHFMAEKMQAGGYSPQQLKVICNFIDDEKIRLISTIQQDKRENAYCYIGRLSVEKGIESLLSIATSLPYKLYIAGTGPLENELKKKYNVSNIQFLGQLDYREVISLLKRVRFSVMPSACYENNPLSVIESLCCGTPVLGSKMGGIPELITDEYSRLFVLNDNMDLQNKILEMFDGNKTINNNRLAKVSISRFSSVTYYNTIMETYINNNICNQYH